MPSTEIELGSGIRRGGSAYKYLYAHSIIWRLRRFPHVRRGMRAVPRLGNPGFAWRWTAYCAKALLVTTYGVPPMFALFGMGNTAHASEAGDRKIRGAFRAVIFFVRAAAPPKRGTRCERSC